jgi:hypothetical protein
MVVPTSRGQSSLRGDRILRLWLRIVGGMSKKSVEDV